MEANVLVEASKRGSSVHSLPRWLVLGTSFWGGFQIMVLEVGGFRVLQTYLGSSVMVTGTLLTIFMILLSAGYYLGGLLSTRIGSARQLFSLLLGAAIYTAIIPGLLLEIIAGAAGGLHAALANDPYLRTVLPAALLALILYGAPVLALSMISPCWIRLQTLDGSQPVGDPGIQSGFFMSLSTIGSIAGTMAGSYVLIPMFGVMWSAIGTGLVLLLISGAGWMKSGPLVSRERVVLASVVLSLVSAILAVKLADAGKDQSIIHQSESLYGQIQIVKEKDYSGRPILNYFPSRVNRHSLLYPEEPMRDMREMMYLAPGFLRAPKKILVLGSAAGSVLRKIELVYPDAQATGVDIDPKAHDIAQRFFGVDAQRHKLLTADARMHLTTDREQYDLIIVDLFAGEFIPVHCISQEFFELVAAHLAPNGAMFVNTAMNDIHFDVPSDDEPFRPLRHLVATLNAVGFDTVFENTLFHCLFVFREDLGSAELRERFLRRFSDESLPLAMRAAAGLAAYMTVEMKVDTGRYAPFTDAWSPAFLIELKSNEVAVYRALGRALERQAASQPGYLGSGVPGAVLKRHLETIEQTGTPVLYDVPTMIDRLNGIDAPLSADAIDVASKYFRFPDEEELPVDGVQARGPWANLALLYAQMIRTADRDEYEALMPVLAAIRDYSHGPS